MLSKNISSMPIRCYPSPMNTGTYRDISLGEYLLSCKSDEYVKGICDWLSAHKKTDDGYAERKTANRCATISCVCGESRKDSDVQRRNPLIVIDIDCQDNPRMSSYEYRSELLQRLALIPSAYAAGISCSGKGIFIIIYIGHNYSDDDFKGAYKALEEEFAESGIIIDEKCKNISRLRFASSHDVLIKKPTTDIPAYEKRVIEEKSDLPGIVMNTGASLGVSKYEVLSEVIDMLIERGFHADGYNSWISCGFALQPFGTLGLDLFEKISRASGNYDGPASVQKKFGELQDSSITENDCYMKFFGLAKKLIGPGYYAKAEARVLERKVKLKKANSNVQNIHQ